MARNTSVRLGRSVVRSFLCAFARSSRNFSATREFRRRENFRKKCSGRRDRFRPQIVEIGAILAIFEPFEVCASNTRNVLFRTQGMSCFEHKECPASNTRNVLLRTQGMFCFEHTECPASSTRNLLRRTHGMSCFEHTECCLLYTSPSPRDA